MLRENLVEVICITMANTRERSLVLVKQDGVQRGLIGEVIRRFENRGFKLLALKFVQVSYSKYLHKKKDPHRLIVIFISQHVLYLKVIMKNIKVN